MKVLFVNFNLGSTPGINNGVASLSAVLKKAGHEVSLIFVCEELGYGLDLNRMKKDVLKFDPDIIGISLIEPQSKYMKAFCSDLRRYYNKFVICGGPYPTMDPEGVLFLKGVDAVCVGEGEGALLELTEALKAGKEYTGIMNLWFRTARGIRKNALRLFSKLDDLPPEDKELFNLGKLLPRKNYQLEVMLGRGCAHKCAYCINGSYLAAYRKYSIGKITTKDYLRVKSTNTVIMEMTQVISHHPKIRKIAFIDDNLPMYIDSAGDFFNKYKRKIRLPFMCNANPISFNLKKGAVLKEAGCDDIRFGVESGSERVKRDIMKRPIPNKAVEDAFKVTRGLGLMSSSFNMIGLPTETRGEVMQTLRLNARILPDTVKVMTFYPFMNTPLYDICAKRGLIDENKKKRLDNYDTFTCLKFSPGHRLFLEKVQYGFNWYINSYLPGKIGRRYRALAVDLNKMTRREWGKFDFEKADKDVSEEMSKIGDAHYVKFVNRSLAIKHPTNNKRWRYDQ